VWFTGVRADVGRGLNTLYVEGRTSNAALINSYESTLRKLPTIERVEAPITGLQGDQTRFTLTAVFKAGAQLPAVGETPKAP
jgi:hypothetical protein